MPSVPSLTPPPFPCPAAPSRALWCASTCPCSAQLGTCPCPCPCPCGTARNARVGGGTAAQRPLPPAGRRRGVLEGHPPDEPQARQPCTTPTARRTARRRRRQVACTGTPVRCVCVAFALRGSGRTACSGCLSRGVHRRAESPPPTPPPPLPRSRTRAHTHTGETSTTTATTAATATK